MTTCHVYACPGREFTYLYVHPDLAWDDLPSELARLFEGAQQIMELDLDPERPLAQEDVVEVIAHLDDPGYHLQMPPTEDPSGWLDLPPRKT